MGSLHGVFPDGRQTRGVETFRQAYRAVGLGWALAPTGWPVLRPVCDALYALFARHRVRLGRAFGRPCAGGRCAVPGVTPGGPPEHVTPPNPALQPTGPAAAVSMGVALLRRPGG
jgi:DCC1-like thiol-disulfide oxidoreductase